MAKVKKHVGHILKIDKKVNVGESGLEKHKLGFFKLKQNDLEMIQERTNVPVQAYTNPGYQFTIMHDCSEFSANYSGGFVYLHIIM